MNWEIDFETFSDLMVIKASGAVDVSGFLGYMKAALTDPRWRKGMPVLLDFRNLETDRVEYPDIQKIAAIFAPYVSAIGSVRVAVVVSRAQDYGMIKIWEVLAREIFSIHEIYFTIDDALAFLRKGPEEAFPD
jgi:hypothetical protein